MYILIFVIVLVLIIAWAVKKKASSETKGLSGHAAIMDVINNVDDSSTVKGAYWESFKQRKPNEAKAIEALLGRDMAVLSNVDAFQLVNTLLRVSSNAGMPISELKESAFEQLFAFCKEDELPMIIERLRQEKSKEAKTFHIKRDNTYSNILLEWAVERQQQLTEERFLKHISDRGLSIDKEAYKKKKEELNLAPDISKLDRIENRLIKVAERGVERISLSYRQLSAEGQKEALLYCTTCLIDLPTNYENSLNLDATEDRYFLLLHDKILPDAAEFINSRIRFYNQEKEKLSNSPHYTPMFIFNAFYLNPLCEKPDYLTEFHESPIELLQFYGALKDLDRFLSEEKTKVQ